MAEHQNAQETESRSLNKALWLAELDALEQEYHAFQQRGGGAQGTAHADVLQVPAATAGR
jgi:hypothetical protein